MTTTPEPRLDVVVVGRSNMDLRLPVPSLPAPGRTVFAQGLFATPGEELAAAGVVTTGLRLLPDVQTGAAVVQVTPDGENAIIVAVSPTPN